jgi:hypothetical protein
MLARKIQFYHHLLSIALVLPTLLLLPTMPKSSFVVYATGPNFVRWQIHEFLGPVLAIRQELVHRNGRLRGIRFGGLIVFGHARVLTVLRIFASLALQYSTVATRIESVKQRSNTIESNRIESTHIVTVTVVSISRTLHNSTGYLRLFSAILFRMARIKFKCRLDAVSINACKSSLMDKTSTVVVAAAGF